jgi:hypothetical protein
MWIARSSSREVGVAFGLHFVDNKDGTATLSGSLLPGVYHITFTATGAGGTASLLRNLSR